MDEYILQIVLVARPSLVYFNNDIKSAHSGVDFSVIQLLSQTIIRTTNFLEGDTRLELDVTITDMVEVCAPSLNELYMIMSKSKAKE